MRTEESGAHFTGTFSYERRRFSLKIKDFPDSEASRTRQPETAEVRSMRQKNLPSGLTL